MQHKFSFRQKISCFFRIFAQQIIIRTAANPYLLFRSFSDMLREEKGGRAMDLFKELFDSRSLYLDFFDRMPEAVYVCDADRRLIYFNKAAEYLDGYQLKEVKGRSTYDLYGLDEKTSPMLRALTTEHPVFNEEFTYYVNGKEIIQLCNSGPIYDDGRLVGAYTIQRDLTAFKDIVEQNIALQQAVQKARVRRRRNGGDDPFGGLIGESAAFRRCVDQARKAAATNSSVMLIGKTGSGKEVFARAIHNAGDRADKPFLALNCAAIPESLIEGILFGTTKGVYTGAVEKDGILAQADGGTVFLDEINSMPPASQAKLLRVLEERKIMKLGGNRETPVDLRVISSTNEAPGEAIRGGRLREDLFYRLAVVHLIIPPLRERMEDLDGLVAFFIDKYNRRFQKNIPGVSPEVMAIFRAFSWPGNVRQLKACVESAMNFTEDGRAIERENLPVYMFEDDEVPENRYRQWLLQKELIHPDAEAADAVPNVKRPEAAAVAAAPAEGGFRDIREEIRGREREEIIAALEKHRGNITQAARALGMSRQSLSYRMKKYQLK